MTLGNRLKKAREAKGLTQSALAELAGISQQSIQKIEAGINAHTRYLKILAKALKCDPAWLQFGSSYINLPHGINISQIAPKIYVPVITWDLATKWPIPEGGYIIDESTELIPYIGNGSMNSYALRIKGDSMTSPMAGRVSFIENEVIIIDPDRDAVHGNYVIAHQANGTEVILRQYIIEGGVHLLRPLNPQYPIIPLDNTIKICGVVIAKHDELV